MKLELLSTGHCHLCDEAEQLVRRACPRLRLALIDIGESDDLIEQYGTRIPVLRYQHRELDWPFSLLDVRALVVGPEKDD